MWIEACCAVAFDARLEREAMLQIIDGVGDAFATAAPRARTGLYVVSDHAGSATSLEFWSQALRTGVDVASPALFPWCLANAPCGALARHFHVTGPNATWLGDGEALLAALESAADALEDARLDAVIVVALEFAKAGGGNALALRMSAAAEGPAQRFDAATARDALPSLLLGAAMAALSRQFSTAAPG